MGILISEKGIGPTAERIKALAFSKRKLSDEASLDS